jgi:hypothetical protein
MDMSIYAHPTDESTVFTINQINVTTSLGQAHRHVRWWEGLTLDQQDELLDRMDPQRFNSHPTTPMTVARWNREKRRVRRARERWIEEIRALRRPCRCDNCRRHHRPPFPKYYVSRGISYECWLEQHAADSEMEDLLQPLRSQRQRIGAVFLCREDRTSGRAD